MIHFRNSAPVKLKGSGGGLRLILDPSLPEDQLISEVDTLFKKLNHLAVNANVTIDVGNAKGQEGLVQRVGTHLKHRYRVGRVTDRPEPKTAPLERTRNRDLSKGWDQHTSDVLILRGRIRSGQRIDTQKHLVVFGDVNPGAEVISQKDVVVLGRLAGKVHAGSKGDAAAMAFALCFAPTHIKIGDRSMAGSDAGKWEVPAFAAVEGGELVIKDYMKSNPFRRLPWPEAV